MIIMYTRYENVPTILYEVPEVEDDSADESSDNEKLEVKLRQYSSTVQSLNENGSKTGEYKVNFVDKDVFGNPIHDEESEVLLRKKSASRRS